MAQTGYSKIQIYSSSTATDTPSAGNLTNDTNGSELAINITDGKLFYKDNSGTVQVIATKGSNVVGGSNTQVQYNSSGTFAGSANLTFDGTTLTSSGFSGPLNGTVGATTANTGSFTTVTAGTSVTTPFITSAAATNLILKSAGTTAVTIDTSQKVTFANSIGFGSNAGITFNNSSATVNSTLNDYETGTWTPNQGAGLTVVGSFSSKGVYTKIGNIVYISGSVSGSTSVALSAGAAVSSNLPFAVASGGSNTGLSINVTLCNNSGSIAIVGEFNSSSLSALYSSIPATTTIFFNGVYTTTF